MKFYKKLSNANFKNEPISNRKEPFPLFSIKGMVLLVLPKFEISLLQTLVVPIQNVRVCLQNIIGLFLHRKC
jgi:hypothetical protein